VIQRCERKELTVDVANATGNTESTLRTTRKKAEKIKYSYKSATRMTAD
jgi:hypothetical protein